jgi:probable H4MPT-linked C1 transfer pathway protein
MQQSIVGWDIGGAHLKAAVVSPDGIISKVFQHPCPLWKGMDYLKQSVSQLLAEISLQDCKHVITMTGELVDLFDNRDEGVKEIIQTMQDLLAGHELLIYAGQNGFLKAQQVQKKHYEAIASANWLASASLVAKQLQQGLFIDIGSTTTDILVLAKSKVDAVGLTDYERMRSGELIYTGIVRTAVMAIAQTAYFNGQKMGLMAEYFATMADVYRLTGDLNENHDQIDTADGAEKTELASAKRLSRMTGYDFAEKDLSLWKGFAQTLKNQQKNKIQQACVRQLSRHVIPDSSAFIGAGIGRFLVRQIASDLGHPYIDFTELFVEKITDSQMDVADCAPSVAVAILASI